jgi:glycosyltransferase involved in cell wall biosynthesis
VHLRNDPLFAITIPSKTQAYMAVGKPLLMAVDGDAADLVKQSGGGVVAPSEDAQALADAAQSLANMDPNALSKMGQQSKVFYEQHLSLAVGVENFGNLFDRLAKR